jgi:CheY-like chemotaxis protein
VKQNDGHISIFSRSGQGTTVNIFLPRVTGESAIEQKKLTLKDLPDGNETVMVVEDDDGVRSMVSLWLKNKGYMTIEASNGKEALEKAVHFDPRSIHLILCDIIMPLIGGKQLYDRFVSLNPDTKVLFISGHTEDFSALHGIERKNLLMKPFTNFDLIHSVQEVLNG